MVLNKKVFGDSPSQPPLVRAGALDALKSPLCGYRGSVALRDEVKGTIVVGSPSGDDLFEQSSPAAKTDEIYSDAGKTTTGLSSRSTQAVLSATCHYFFSRPTWCPRPQSATC
jgi:hypothetical protein